MNQSPESIIRENGGQIRMHDAINFGISRYQLYTMYNQGILEKMTRGVYKLAEMPVSVDSDIAAVSTRYPESVICLISALSFHQITTQIPHKISIAVSHSSRVPILDSPPIHGYRFSHESFISGIEKHEIDGFSIRVYCPEKTIADCFKFRNKLGMDIVIEAIKLYKTRMKINVAKLMQYAHICRVEKVMTPYIEMII